MPEEGDVATARLDVDTSLWDAKLTETSSGMGKWANGVGDKVAALGAKAEKVGESWTAFGKKGEAALSGIQSLAEGINVGDVLAGGEEWEKLKATGGEAWGNVKAAALEAGAAAKETYAQLPESIRGPLDKAAESIKTTLAPVGSAVAKTFAPIAEAAQRVGRQISEHFITPVTESAKKITDTIRSAVTRGTDIARGIGDRASSLLGRANTAIGGQSFGDLGAKAKGLQELPSDAIGSALGGGIGAAIGTFFGGPAGTAIGQKIGGVLGTAAGMGFDLTPLTHALEGVLDAAGEVAKSVGEWWGEVTKDAGETFGRVRAIVSELSLGELLTGDFGASWEKIEAIGVRVFGEWEGFVARFLDKVRNLVDAAWGKAQEPIAKLVDFIQRVLEKVGLVETGTASWGDRIRDIKDVGQKVFVALATGLGFLEGVFRNVGGIITKYVVVPALEAISLVYRNLASMYAAIGSAVGGDLGDSFAKKAEVMKTVLDKFRNEVIPEIKKAAQTQIDVDPKALSDERGKQVGDELAKGQQENAAALKEAGDAWLKGRIDAAIAFTERAGAQVRGFGNLFTEQKNPFKNDASKTQMDAMPSGSVALLKGSREAANFIAEAQSKAANSNPIVAAAQKIAESVEASGRRQSQMIDLLQAIKDDLSGGPVLKVS